MIKNLYITKFADGEWYISDGNDNYLWKDFAMHKNSTGFSITKSAHSKYGEAPGFYPTREIAQAYLDEYNKRNNLGEKKMSQNYAMIEGKRVELSEETTSSIKKALGIPVEPEQVKVHCFRANKNKFSSYPYRLGCAGNPYYNWDGDNKDAQGIRITCFTENEVKKIIAGLQRLLTS